MCLSFITKLIIDNHILLLYVNAALSCFWTSEIMSHMHCIAFILKWCSWTLFFNVRNIPGHCSHRLFAFSKIKAADRCKTTHVLSSCLHLLTAPEDIVSLGKLSREIPFSRNVQSFEVRQKEESPLSCETSESHRAMPEGATPPP